MSFVRTALSGALLAIGIAAVAPAQATYFQGTWDPTYGAPFTNLGWRGNATFFLPAVPPCATSGAACIAGSFLDNANVEFYDTTSSAVIGSISWSNAELTQVSITSVTFVPGNPDPTQIATSTAPGTTVSYKAPTLLPGVDPTTYGAIFGQAAFSLGFVIDQTVPVSGGLYSGPVLNWRGPSGCTTPSPCFGSNDIQQFPPIDFKITVSPVPEPSTLVLSLAGLAGLAVLTRRRRADRVASTTT